MFKLTWYSWLFELFHKPEFRLIRALYWLCNLEDSFIPGYPFTEHKELRFFVILEILQRPFPLSINLVFGILATSLTVFIIWWSLSTTWKLVQIWRSKSKRDRTDSRNCLFLKLAIFPTVASLCLIKSSTRIAWCNQDHAFAPPKNRFHGPKGKVIYLKYIPQFWAKPSRRADIS